MVIISEIKQTGFQPTSNQTDYCVVLVGNISECLSISTRDKKSSSGSGVAPSGHVGRFKNGMLVLSSKEIQKIKGKR